MVIEVKKVSCWRKRKLVDIELGSKPLTLDMIWRGINPQFEREFSTDEIIKFFEYYNTPIKRTTLNARLRYLRRGGWIRISKKSWLGYSYKLNKKSFNYVLKFCTFTNPEGYLMKGIK